MLFLLLVQVSAAHIILPEIYSDFLQNFSLFFQQVTAGLCCCTLVWDFGGARVFLWCVTRALYLYFLAGARKIPSEVSYNRQEIQS